MREKVEYFTADYRDGRVHIGGNVYQAGYFATHMLNQFYDNDTAARIAVFTTDNWHLERTLEIGYMDIKDFLQAGERMLNIFTALPWLSPFNMLDTKAERERVAKLFTEENHKKITEYWRRKAEVYNMTDEQAWLDRVPKSYDKEFMTEARDLLGEVFFTLDFYNELKEDMQKAFYALREFISHIDEADKFDEEHLLPIALETFGSAAFPVQTEYVGIKKSSRSKTATVARRLYFENYYSFILTDFFEGLHHGHYKRYITDRFNREIFNLFQLTLDGFNDAELLLLFFQFFSKCLFLLVKQNGNDLFGMLLGKQFADTIDGNSSFTQETDNPHPF